MQHQSVLRQMAPSTIPLIVGSTARPPLSHDVATRRLGGPIQILPFSLSHHSPSSLIWCRACARLISPCVGCQIPQARSRGMNVLNGPNVGPASSRTDHPRRIAEARSRRPIGCIGRRTARTVTGSVICGMACSRPPSCLSRVGHVRDQSASSDLSWLATGGGWSASPGTDSGPSQRVAQALRV